ncbi:MAG: hypothetical protein COU28_00875 [Candidatus Magasanikbacteria bacterium CG10_big_fil_rev_8_21_14_0_10_36_16]|uniref:bAvd-like domain-containing protein n=1 Tax=Candidatus Magasanikbacteria bacterium CG10_big_fil_rev_8_21_14_0_10_36_16 TaxID=1974645 RepID=A0A2H0TZE6_9BACT|nr:MAG: hypothetical protein COU28_00875 [Candidatus Magasanikbacteria bacterium CG10_big_fil_rev_8_21_14_0_10_36_16]
MHNEYNKQDIIIFNQLYDFCCLWHQKTKKFPKSDKYTLGQKIFLELLDILMLIHQARFEQNYQKIKTLDKTSQMFDSVKILIRMTYTLEIIEQKTYIELENDLQNIGKMLGGWLKYLKNPQTKATPLQNRP